MKFLPKAKKLITILTAIAILIGVPVLCPLEADAAGPITYAVKYVPDSSDWRYQANTSAFDDNAPHRDLYYLRQELKDGDLVVVYNDSPSVPALDLGTKRLSNLTVTSSSSFAIIYCGEIDDCYLLGGASCSINANVANAYVYDTVLCNFNKNVKELNVCPLDDMTSTIGCSGTVDHLYAVSRTTGRTYHSLYSFQAGSLDIKDGALMTASSKYSTAPSPTSSAVTKETFNYIRYADKNPDLKAAFGYDAKLLYKHYTAFGIAENRGNYSIYDTFDYVRYADDFADLKASFGYDAKALYKHYVTYGMAEDRGNYFK